MIIENLKNKWGSVIHGTKDEVLNLDPQQIRQLGYEKDLIIFKGLGELSKGELYKITSYFGTPWSIDEYAHSREPVKQFLLDDKIVGISEFSNTKSKLGEVEMPWHVDIPNWGEKSFPWRALYMVNNPNPDGGLTTWANLRLENLNPTKEDLDLYERMSVLNQSWHNGEDKFLVKQPYIKKHLVTGVESLRTNYFRSEDSSPQAWIKQVYIDDIPRDNKEVLGPIHLKISKDPELNYTHRWDTYDLIIYDNWNLMHRRTHLGIDSTEERLFYRLNIHHDK